MLAGLAVIVFVIGAVLQYQGADHALVLLFVGLALLAAEALAPYRPWTRR